MNHHDAVVNGLRHQGWNHHSVGWKNRVRWESFRHPQKGTRTLWVTPKGSLYVGPTTYSSDPVNPTFIEITIQLGRQDIR